MDEKYFEQIDRQITSNPKYQWLLYLGVILFATVLFTQIVISTVVHPQTFDGGLTIQYTKGSFGIDFTNENNDVTSMLVTIYTNYNTDKPTVVYENEYTNFPARVTYAPYAKDIEHTVHVTLTRNTGQYTYTYSVLPARAEILDF